jgi:hypothetical protein
VCLPFFFISQPFSFLFGFLSFVTHSVFLAFFSVFLSVSLFLSFYLLKKKWDTISPCSITSLLLTLTIGDIFSRILFLFGPEVNVNVNGFDE